MPLLGTYDSFINFYVDSNLQLFLVLTFASYKQSNPHLPKFAKKGTTRSREVLITEQMSQNTFM